MASQLKNRIVTPDGEAIQRLRIEKGWRVEDLAKKARCSLKTVENVERGGERLPVPAQQVRPGARRRGLNPDGRSSTPGAPKKGLRFTVQFTLEVPFEEFDESEHLVSFLTMLKQIVQAKDEIMVVGVQEGSTIITLEMGMDDIERLIHEFTGSRAKAALDAFRVAQLKLPDSQDFTLTQPVEFIDEGRGTAPGHRVPKGIVAARSPAASGDRTTPAPSRIRALPRRNHQGASRYHGTARSGAQARAPGRKRR